MADFPNSTLILNIIFFVLVAVFLIFTARMIMERSEPKFIIGMTIPLSFPLLRKRKGFLGPDLLITIVLVVVVLIILILSWIFIGNPIDAIYSLVTTGILSIFGFFGG